MFAKDKIQNSERKKQNKVNSFETPLLFKKYLLNIINCVLLNPICVVLC